MKNGFVLVSIIVCSVFSLSACSLNYRDAGLIGYVTDSERINGHDMRYKIDGQNVVLDDSVSLRIPSEYDTSCELRDIDDTPITSLGLTKDGKSAGGVVHGYAAYEPISDDGLDTLQFICSLFFGNLDLNDYKNNIAETDHMQVFAMPLNNGIYTIVYKKGSDEFVYIFVKDNNISLLNVLLEDSIRSFVSEDDFKQLDSKAGGYVNVDEVTSSSSKDDDLTRRE